MTIRSVHLLIGLISIICVQSERGPFRSSYVFMTAENKRTGSRVSTCVNYQQYLLSNTPSSLVAENYESAKPFTLKFWKGVHNLTKLCPLPPQSDPQQVYHHGIVPIEYRIDDDGTKCTRHFSISQTAFRNASQFTDNVLKEHQAGASLMIMDRGRRFVQGWRDYLFSDFYDPYINSTTSIPTFFIYRSDFNEKVLSVTSPDDVADDDIEVRFHRPSPGPFDLSMAVIWLIAMVCVTGGGLWAHHRHRAGKDTQMVTQSIREEESSEGNREKGIMEKCGNVITIAVMMSVLCGVLLLGYFFRPILVFFFNIMLVIFGTTSIHGCLMAFLSNFPFAHHSLYTAKINFIRPLFGRTEKYSYSSLFVVILSFAFCTTWFFTRRQPYAFIQLDIINMALCLHVLKCLRLPSLKWISILMLCMFFYDAFMVFGTKYITPNGCSIMLEVATGLSKCSGGKEDEKETSGYPVPPVEMPEIPEKFPMLMQVAHVNPMNACIDLEVELNYQVTILGLGDIVMPGYLIAHCFTMNGFSERIRLLYGFVSIVGYGFGLIVTFLALSLMKVAQPALIYLVPFTLFPIMLIAVFRGEFRKIWNGEPIELTILENERAGIRGKKWVDEQRTDSPRSMDNLETNTIVVDSSSSSTSGENAPENV